MKRYEDALVTVEVDVVAVVVPPATAVHSHACMIWIVAYIGSREAYAIVSVQRVGREIPTVSRSVELVHSGLGVDVEGRVANRVPDSVRCNHLHSQGTRLANGHLIQRLIAEPVITTDVAETVLVRSPSLVKHQAEVRTSLD